MSEPAAQAPSRSVVGDLWGGLTATLVALPSSVAFGVAVTTTLDPGLAGVGALTGLLGAVALGIVAPLVGRTAGLISAPCAPAAAVLSATALGLTGMGDVPRPPQEVLGLLALTVLMAALLQTLFGLAGGGRLVKYIPFPVVSGYLSAVGLLIALGQLPKLLGLPKGVGLADGLLAPGRWQPVGLAAGVVTAAVTMLARRLTKRVPGPVLGLTAGIVTYLLASVGRPELLELEGNPLLVGALQVQGSVLDASLSRLRALASIGPEQVRLVIVPALTLSFLLSIDTLKTGVLLDTLTRARHDSNRSLVGQGAGNLVAFLLGGMPGAGTSGPTLINISSGGHSWRSGLFEGLCSLLAFVALGELIGWVPIGALAGILLVVAYRMIDWGAFRLLLQAGTRLDFAVIALVVAVAVVEDLVLASGVGVALSILLFVRDQVRTSVVRRALPLTQISSKTRRLQPERDLLRQHGELGLLVEVQGNLFFGTTDQLYTELEADLARRRFILIDMRRVRTLDYTAAHLLDQMQERLAERGGGILLSGAPSALPHQRDIEHYLAEVGVLTRDGGSGVRIFETRDAALEWMEASILAEAGWEPTREERPLELGEIEPFRGLDEQTRAALQGCLQERTLGAGERLFAQGDTGGELFLIRRGSVRILLPLTSGKVHHLATFARGDFFGELAFLDGEPRSAAAEAKEPTQLYALSRRRFDEWSAAHPAMRAQVLEQIALGVARRMRVTDGELRALEER